MTKQCNMIVKSTYLGSPKLYRLVGILGATLYILGRNLIVEIRTGKPLVVSQPAQSSSSSSSPFDVVPKGASPKDVAANVPTGTGPRVILHIGPHKTATSTVQEYIKRSHVIQWLGADNVSMPTFEDLPGRERRLPEFNFASCVAHFGGCHGKTTLPKFSEYSNRTFHENKDILLVAEDLDRLETLDFDLLKKALLPYTNIQVVIVYRRLPDWYRSWYNEIMNLYSEKNRVSKKFDSFPQFLADKFDLFYARHTIGLEQAYRNHGFSFVSVLHFHRKDTTVLENLFCHVIANLPNTCQGVLAAKSEANGTSADSKQVVFQTRNYHPHSFEVCRWIWLMIEFDVPNDDELMKRCQRVGDHYLDILRRKNISLPQDFPVIRLPKDTVEKAWNATVLSETRYFSMMGSATNGDARQQPTPAFWKEIRAEFDRAVYNKWFSIDVDELKRTKQYDYLLPRKVNITRPRGRVVTVWNTTVEDGYA